jgi:hypothetical protein
VPLSWLRRSKILAKNRSQFLFGNLGTIGTSNDFAICLSHRADAAAYRPKGDVRSEESQ